MLRGGQEVEEVDWSGVQGRHGSHQRKDVKASHVYSLTDNLKVFRRGPGAKDIKFLFLDS